MEKPDNILVKHYAGSIAYGTNLPTSDVDFRGIFCDPPQGIITPWTPKRNEIWVDKSEEDSEYSELHKYMGGYVDGSPNVLETLWVEEGDIVQSSPAYEYLRSHRSELLSKKLRYTFGGYALGQMKRIKGHHKWINNPQPENPPVREDYFKLIQNFLPERIFGSNFNIQKYNVGHILVPYGNNIQGLVCMDGGRLFNPDGSIKKVDYESLPDEIKKASPAFIVKLNEDVYRADKDVHKNYWTWRNERNEKRSELEAKYGYDCKHAMHIVRLLRMGEEVLRDGVINVKRPDAQELLDIRNGKWKLDELIEWSEHQDNLIGDLMKTSPLPDKVDKSLATKILIEAEEIANELDQSAG